MLDFLNELKVSMDVSQGITDSKPLVMVITRMFLPFPKWYTHLLLGSR